MSEKVEIKVQLPNGQEVSFTTGRTLGAVVAARKVSGRDVCDWFVQSKHATVDSAKAKVARNESVPTWENPFHGGWDNFGWEYAIIPVNQ